MPITISAKKKMRQDKKRRLVNLRGLSKLEKTLSKARKSPSAENVRQAYSVISRTAKKKLIHRNKADRLKSRLAKRLSLAKPRKKTGKKK